MNETFLYYSRYQFRDEYLQKIIHATQKKKVNNLYIKKQNEEGVKENPSNIIWNLTIRVLSNEEYQVLPYSLNHVLLTKSKALSSLLRNLFETKLTRTTF